VFETLQCQDTFPSSKTSRISETISAFFSLDIRFKAARTGSWPFTHIYNRF